MPRIRKQTSNRNNTNDRRKLHNKIRESRKKKTKAAKNSTQWKSKQKKDPGIPSTFPYKEQILAEIADQRREAADEKQRRREEKTKLKNKQNGVVEDEQKDTEQAGSGDDGVLAEVKARGLNQGFEGISSISAKQLDETKVQKRQRPAPMQVDEPEEEDIPVLINHELPNLQAVLDAADVVVEVLDARDPLAFRSEHLEELASKQPGRHVLFILNKIDTCPRESASSWVTHLRASHPTVAFRSASCCLPEVPASNDKGKGKAKAQAGDALGADSVLELLGTWAEEKEGNEPLCVAVIGVTNVGKTSFVNSLLRKPVLPVYTLATSSRGPTTTSYAQEVTVVAKTKTIRLIDTPGLAWESRPRDENEDNEENGEIRARDILLRSKGRIDRLKDPVFAVKHLVPRAITEDLMLFYNLPAFSADDTDAFLSCVARANQLVKKRGELDLTGAARIVLRDWNTGKFPWYTVPVPASTETESLSAVDEAVLNTLQTRKELRKARGLVKLKCGAVETRRAILDQSWTPDTVEDDEEDEASDDEEEASMEQDEDDEDESSDGSDDSAPPIVSGKQKRKRAVEKAASLPRKKVSFGADPKSSKKARSAAGAAQQPSSQKAPVKMKTAAPKKVANAPVKTKASQKAATGAGGSQAYNFGEFF
ncbi:hypothetical protein C8F01DRAFT_581849 [Mycena amicta]|nr:hypothetical protein C8F01DRAFT_581849 [Mycena amicta]